MAIAKGGLAAIVVAVLGHVPAPVAADDPHDDVSMHATAYEQIPADAIFDLEPADNSELTYQVERLVRTSLQRRGYRLGDDSPLVLTIVTEATEAGADTPWPMQLGASKGGLRMRLFLFGPNSSGLLQDGRKPTAGEYRISLSVHDRWTRGYLWRGMATACQCGQGMLASSREMVPVLVEAIGRSVRPESTASGAPQ